MHVEVLKERCTLRVIDSGMNSAKCLFSMSKYHPTLIKHSGIAGQCSKFVNLQRIMIIDHFNPYSKLIFLV